MISSLQCPANKSAKNGFTLIEMLVVITIIAVLSTISMVAYSRIQQTARDTKRQSDLKVIESALEHFRADQGNYPLAITFNRTTPGSIAASSVTYLSKVPVDPISDPHPNYSYSALPLGCNNTSGNYCYSYCLYASVENASNASSSIPTDCSTLPSGYSAPTTLIEMPQ